MEKTLIVLGAGASKDFCRIFPTGLELIKEINYRFITQKKLKKNTHEYISDMMNQIVKSFLPFERFEKIKEVLWEIQEDYAWRYLRSIVAVANSPKSKPEDLLSIDRFIAEQIQHENLDQTDENIIKFCIYYLIIGYEEPLAGIEYRPKGCWIDLFAKKLGKYQFQDVLEKLTVITFNYDRTFEQYFPDYLTENKNALNEDQKCALRENVKHVYGSLGCLKKVPFGLKNNNETVREMYPAIELINDRVTSEIEIANAEQFKKVHFIGFGYDEENLRRINLDRFTHAKFQGTAYHPISGQIKDLKKRYKIKAKDITCRGYISEMEI